MLLQTSVKFKKICVLGKERKKKKEKKKIWSESFKIIGLVPMIYCYTRWRWLVIIELDYGKLFIEKLKTVGKVGYKIVKPWFYFLFGLS